jgi:hypothetical protein
MLIIHHTTKTWGGTFHASISPNDCHAIENDGRVVLFHMTKYIDAMSCVGNDNMNK